VTQPRADSLSKLPGVLSELQLKGGEKKLGEGAERASNVKEKQDQQTRPRDLWKPSSLLDERQPLEVDKFGWVDKCQSPEAGMF
jgi:hypothetical protein